MKILTLMIGLGCLLLASEGFSQQIETQSTTSIKPQKELQMAKEGCQKNIGWFPTPSKLMCILYATGQNEKEVKTKVVALIFSVCQGRVTKADTTGITPKSYETLGQCLSDPNALTLINSELQAYKYQPIDLKVVKKNMEDLKIAPAIVTQPVTEAPNTQPTTNH